MWPNHERSNRVPSIFSHYYVVETLGIIKFDGVLSLDGLDSTFNFLVCLSSMSRCAANEQIQFCKGI